MTEDSVGARIKALRESHKMTHEELGAAIGMSGSTVKDIESGKGLNLRADTLRALCETFNVFPRVLLYDTDEEFWRRAMDFGGEGGGYLATFLKSPMGPKVLHEEIGENGVNVLGSLTRLNASGISRAKTLIGDLLKISEYSKNK